MIKSCTLYTLYASIQNCMCWQYVWIMDWKLIKLHSLFFITNILEEYPVKFLLVCLTLFKYCFRCQGLTGGRAANWLSINLIWEVSNSRISKWTFEIYTFPAFNKKKSALSSFAFRRTLLPFCSSVLEPNFNLETIQIFYNRIFSNHVKNGS